VKKLFSSSCFVSVIKFTNSLIDTLIMIDLKMILTICRLISNNSVHVNIIFILNYHI